MNKFIRALLIVFAACLVLGGGLLIAGIALGGTWGDASVSIGADRFHGYDMFDHGLFKFEGSTHYSDESDTPEMTGTTNEMNVVAADIHELELTLHNCEFEILSSADDQIRVEIEDGKEEFFSVREKEGTLHINDIRKREKSIKSVYVKLWIPSDLVFDRVNMTIGAGDITIDRLAADTIDIEGGAGKIKAETLIANNELDAEIGAGEFYITEATLGETDIDCGVGRFEIGSCTLNGNAEISGGVGDVNIGIVGEKEDFNYELSCGMGELDVFDESYTSLGKDKEIDNGARYTISLECGVGRVNVYRKAGNRNSEVLDHHEEHYDEEPDHHEEHFD